MHPFQRSIIYKNRPNSSIISKFDNFIFLNLIALHFIIYIVSSLVKLKGIHNIMAREEYFTSYINHRFILLIASFIPILYCK